MHTLMDERDDEIKLLRAALTEAASTLTEAANCLRPTFPSLADNVIEACAERMRRTLDR